MIRALSLAALALACAASASVAQTLKPWRHGVIEPKSDAGFVTMVTKHDFAARFGLKVEMVPLKNGNLAIKALLSGDLDSVESGAGEGIVAGAAGADLRLIGCNWPGLPHAVFVKSEINEVGELKGKSIAASSPGSLPELLARALLEKYGIPVSDVNIASVGGDLDRYKALTIGRVDAAVISSEYLPIAPKTIKILLAGRDVIPNFMRLCLQATGKSIRERGEDVAKFLAAEIVAGRYAVAHRDETIALAREISEAKPDDPRPAFVFDETVKYRDFDPEMPLPLDKLAWMQQQLLKTGNVRQPIDLDKLTAPGVRARALALAGQ